MKIAIASDHRGVRVKGHILARIEELGHTALDFGPEDAKSVDYPDYAFQVAEAVCSGEVDRGILICGTGMGMCIAANKFPGVRAVTCHDDVTAEYSRRHNNANIMCLSADMLGDRLLDRIVEIWLRSEFEGGRHQRRLEKIAHWEATHGCRVQPHPDDLAHSGNGNGVTNGIPLVHGSATSAVTSEEP